MNKRILTFLMILMAVCLSAQMLPLRNYDTRDGLTQNQVVSSFQDTKGFIWLRTHGGISRFDGFNFKNYTVSNGLASNNLKGMMEDEDEGVFYFYGFTTLSVLEHEKMYAFDEQWFRDNLDDEIINITWDSDSLETRVHALSETTVYQYRHDRKTFEKVFDLTTLPIEIDKQDIGLMFSGSDQFLVTTAEKLLLVDQKQNKIKNLTEEFDIPTGEELFTSLIEIDGREDEFFFYTYDLYEEENYIFLYNRRKNEVNLILEAPSIEFIYGRDKDNDVSIYRDEEGAYWFLTSDGYIQRYKLGTPKAEKTEYRFDTKIVNIKESQDNVLFENELWLATTHGLGKLSLDTGKTLLYTEKNGLSSNTIETVLLDREDNLWFGTNGTGIDMLIPGKITNYTSRNGLPHQSTANTVETPDGSIWFSSDRGVARLYPDGSIRNYTHKDGLTNDHAWALSLDANNQVWVGCLYGDIFRFDGRRFVNMVPEGAKKDPSYITEILLDSDGVIWIPRYDEIIKYSGNRPTTISFDEPVSIYEMIEDHEGHLWCAAADFGLLKLDKEGNILAEYKPDPQLFTSNVVDLLQFDNNTIWCATYGEGIVVFDIEKEKYVEKIVDVFKDAEIVKSLIRDKLGNIWIGTINGIFEYRDGKYRKYTMVDGLVANSTRSNGSYVDREGNVWFNSAFGAIKIDPYKSDTDKVPPLLYIHTFTTKERQVVEPGEELYVLPYFDNDVNFAYIGLDFRYPRQVEYQFYLENYDSDWSEPTNENRIRYTNLDPGLYTFKVKASDRHGNTSETAEIKFQIKKAFWETFWFYGLEVILLGGLVWLIVRWRLAILKSRNEELERLVQERTHELNEKNQQIMSSIRYSKRIQGAILPVLENLKKVFDDVFIIYKPRDIIAGDFYWFSIEDKYRFIAAADCTGHGVPGALLSIIGNMLLNEIVKQHKTYDPSKILAELHVQMQIVLRQENPDASTRDGLEICLCRVEKGSDKMVFAGAGRPLYISRRQEGRENAILLEFKGDNKGIGGKQREEVRTFTDHEIELMDHDMVYLTTDGFIDQNNPEDMKFGSRRLKELFSEIADKSVEEQKQILEQALRDHQQHEEQRDDITLMGFRFGSNENV